MTTGGIWRIGIPGFHELDQHLEAPLLPGVRIMVTLVFASCSFLFFSPCFALFLLLFNSSCLLLLLLLLFPPLFYLHSIGLWALLCLLLSCFVLMFGRIAFSCACCLRSPRRFVAVALLYLLPTPLLSDLSFHSYPVFCLCLLCLDAWSRSPPWWPCLTLDFLCLVKVIPYCINLFF